MNLVEYKLFSTDVKLLYPLKAKLNPIHNFTALLVRILNRKQNPLHQVRFLL